MGSVDEVQLLTRRLLADAWQEHRAGRLGAAEAAYRQILARRPDDSEANNLLGLLCLQTGRPAAARALISRALQADPDNAQSEYNLALACLRLGQPAEAEAHFRRASGLRPDDVEALNGLANVLRLRGRRAEARRVFDAALALAPRHARLHCNLGHLLQDEGRLEDAETSLRRALAADPDLLEALNGLGETLLARGQPGAAREVLERTVATHASSADSWNNLGVACEREGRYEQASSAFRRAVELQPGHARARMNLGRLDEQAGRLGAAATRYREAIAADGSCVDAYFHLAQLRSHPLTAGEIRAMRELARRVEDGRQRARLHAGLGQALEAAGDFAGAFENMQRAHAELGRLHPFSLAAEQARTDRIVATFDPALIDRLRGCGVEDERPVLIVGLPRSGTTLVEQIVASHASVFGLGETLSLPAAVRAVSARPELPFPAGLGALEPAALQAAAAQYLASITERSGDALRVTDTTPMNFVLLGMAALMLPSARFVYCRRDPLDQCLSIYRQWLSGPHAYAHDLGDLGGYWRLHRRLMQHWQAVFPGRIHELRYETLVAEPERTIRELLDFCGLPFQPQCLSFHRTERDVRSPSASLVRRPLHSGSIGTWQRYRAQLAPLVAALGDAAEDHAPGA